MHIFTHLKAASEGKTGLGIYADGMVEHDGHVGQLLAKLKELGLDENTIVMYSTDNGAETFTWPDGGTTMFRGEKNTNWEGGYRVPTVIKWPGVIKPGTVDQRHRRARGHAADAGGRGRRQDRRRRPAEGPHDRRPTYKVHLDGYDLGPALRAAKAPGRARSSSTGPTTAASPRCATTTWKVTFLKQKAEGLQRLAGAVHAAARAAAHEPAHGSVRARRGRRTRWAISAGTWSACSAIAPAGAFVGQWLQSFKDFPPRQKPGSFNLDRVMETVMSSSKQ